MRHLSVVILLGSSLLSGCTPSNGNSYMTPQAQGQLMHFKPTERQPFTDIPVGQTIEYLLFSEGTPTTIKKMSDFIESYYYQDTNTSYIVNTETGYICSATVGKHTGSCPAMED